MSAEAIGSAQWAIDTPEQPTIPSMSTERIVELERRHRSLFRILKHDLEAAAGSIEELNFIAERMTEVLYNAIITAVEIDTNA